MLKEEGISRVVASTKIGRSVGMMKKAVVIKRTFFGDVLVQGNLDEIDGIIIFGGSGAELSLWNNRDLHDILRILQKRGKVIAAIGTAPVVLARAKLLKGKEATVASGPYVREIVLKKAIFINKDVVFREKIITARNYTAANEFITLFMRHLKGEELKFSPTKAKDGFEF